MLNHGKTLGDSENSRPQKNTVKPIRIKYFNTTINLDIAHLNKHGGRSLPVLIHNTPKVTVFEATIWILNHTVHAEPVIFLYLILTNGI